MGKTLEVNSSSWEKDVLSAEGLVMVDFWASWCGPCKMIAPLVEELAEEYDGKVKVLKLNTDENPDVAGKYQVMGIPTMMFFKDGKMIDKSVGAASKQQFKEKIESILSQSS
ncbi:MAG: thioredoxin [Nitrospirota bacterium]